jgi:hypothetical protein
MVTTRSKSKKGRKLAGAGKKQSSYHAGMGERGEGRMPTWRHIPNKGNRIIKKRAKRNWERGDKNKYTKKGNLRKGATPYFLMDRTTHDPHRKVRGGSTLTDEMTLGELRRRQTG